MSTRFGASARRLKISIFLNMKYGSACGPPSNVGEVHRSGWRELQGKDWDGLHYWANRSIDGYLYTHTSDEAKLKDIVDARGFMKTRGLEAADICFNLMVACSIAAKGPVQGPAPLKDAEQAEDEQNYGQNDQ